MRPPPSWRGELLPCAAAYFFLALINLRLKVRAAAAWTNGELDAQHAALLAFQSTNNEQSRVLQWAVPEALVRLTGLPVAEAYMLQRWGFVWLALALFHAYLRAWFPGGLAFAAVCFLAAVLPLTYIHDLQESAPLLMVTFLLGLWAARARRAGPFALALAVGALVNETTLVLPAVWFFDRLAGWRPAQVWSAGWRAVAVAAPAYLVTAALRYALRDRPHLGGAWHLPDNLLGLAEHLRLSPLAYHQPLGLYSSVVLIFGALWLYAYLGWSRKPRFVRAGLLMAPFFVGGNLLTGVVAEVRQLVPLGYVIVPAALFWLFPAEAGAGAPAGAPAGPGAHLTVKPSK